jgi:hypothetical protein
MTLPTEPPKGLLHLINQKAIEESAEFAVANFSKAMIFNTREELWNYCIERIPSLQTKSEIIVEFGVWKGESINFFAKKTNARIYGFDSFEGLEEDWNGTSLSKNFFSTSGKLPKCEKNVKLFKGWFTETVPDFVYNLKSSQVKILHMDADTYKPTAYVFKFSLKEFRQRNNYNF